MSRRAGSIERAYFDRLYAADPDPWRFASSDYERDKYAASLAALPYPSYHAALEIGCSIGVFTELLAARCRTLLGIDVSDAALAVARQRCLQTGVTFENRRIPEQWPDGRFDLIVFSEVLYYLDASDLATAASCAKAALMPGGTILLVHYLGETDYPMSGEDAADTFIAAAAIPVVRPLRTMEYRLDVLQLSGTSQ